MRALRTDGITDLIFDFFGTLVGYTPGHLVGEPYEATHQLVRDAGLDTSYEAFTASFSAAFEECEAQAQATLGEFPMDAVVRRFVLAQGGAVVSDDRITAITAQYVRDWNRGTVFFPELGSLLRELAGHFRLSIISNTHYAPLIHDNLAAMGVADLFAQVITSVEFGVRKPHPAIFAHGLARLGITPAQALYVGDSYEADYQGAKHAGLHAILIDPQQRYPAMVGARISSLFDLRELLAGGSGWSKGCPASCE